jgi:signal peptidase I
VSSGVDDPPRPPSADEFADSPGGDSQPAIPGLIQAPAPPVERERGVFGWMGPAVGPWVELVVVVGLAFAAAYLVQWFVVKPYRIPSESMESTLLVGDRVLVARFWYRFSDPQRGQVIVFHPPGEGSEVIDHSSTPANDLNFIKRVVGLPGEWVGGYKRQVWICPTEPPGRQRPAANCRALKESYTSSVQRRFTFQLVPAGRYFVMGDNRDNSDDSRVIGTIPRSWILGRAFVTYWPLTRIGSLA